MAVFFISAQWQDRREPNACVVGTLGKAFGYHGELSPVEGPAAKNPRGLRHLGFWPWDLPRDSIHHDTQRLFHTLSHQSHLDCYFVVGFKISLFYFLAEIQNQINRHYKKTKLKNLSPQIKKIH